MQHFPLPKTPYVWQLTAPVMIKKVVTNFKTYNLNFVLDFVNLLQFYVRSISPISSSVSLENRECGVRKYDQPFCLMFNVCRCDATHSSSFALISGHKAQPARVKIKQTSVRANIYVVRHFTNCSHVFVGYKKHFLNTHRFSKCIYAPGVCSWQLVKCRMKNWMDLIMNECNIFFQPLFEY